MTTSGVLPAVAVSSSDFEESAVEAQEPAHRRGLKHVLIFVAVGVLGILAATMLGSGSESLSTDPLVPAASRAPANSGAFPDALSSARRDAAVSEESEAPQGPVGGEHSIGADVTVEPWKAFRLQELEDRWEVVQKEIESGATDPMMSISFLVQISVRPCADEMGLGVLLPPGVVTKTETLPGTVYLAAGSPAGTVNYHIPEGLFPALDYWARTCTELERQAEEAQHAALAAGLRPPDRPFFPVDEAFLQDLEALKEQARLALLARSEPY